MTTTPNRSCRFDWCDGGLDAGEHWTMTYTSASHPAYRMLTVGAGVSWLEAEDGTTPAVVVHICSWGDDTSGSYVDQDVHLRLDEAMELRAVLDRAISIAETTRQAVAK